MMDRWETVALPDVLFFQEGPGVRNTQYTSSGVKLLNVANLQDGKVDLSTSSRYISEDEAYGKYKHFLVDDGDFIIASSGIQVDYFEKKMGFVSASQLPLCMNTSTIRFKALDCDRLDIRFFMYYLKTPHFKAQLSRLITGSAQLNFGPSHIKKMTMPLPPLGVQRTIIDMLDRAAALIEKRKVQIGKLDLLVKSRFIEVFGDPVTNPKQWPLNRLRDICDVRDGTHDSPKYVFDGFPLLTSKNFTKGFIDFTNANLISEADFIAINKRSKVDIGDIVMPMIGTIGSPIIVDTEEPFAIKNVALIKFPHAIVSNMYIKLLLSSHYFETAIQDSNRGGTQKFIALGDIRNLAIPLPPLELQNKFTEFVCVVEKSKSEIMRGLNRLELLYKSLIQKCFMRRFANISKAHIF